MIYEPLVVSLGIVIFTHVNVNVPLITTTRTRNLRENMFFIFSGQYLHSSFNNSLLLRVIRRAGGTPSSLCVRAGFNRDKQPFTLILIPTVNLDTCVFWIVGGKNEFPGENPCTEGENLPNLYRRTRD